MTWLSLNGLAVALWIQRSEIWQKIQNEMVSKHIHFIQWDTHDELQNMLFNTLMKELNLDGRDDSKKFELRVRGVQNIKGTCFSGKQEQEHLVQARKQKKMGNSFPNKK